MKNITLKSFLEKSNIPVALIRAVIKQIGGYEAFKDHASDVVNHGADGGFSGFIYHTDTVAFTKRQKQNIIDFATEQADEIGYTGGLFEMLASFNCFKNYNQSEIADGLYNPKSASRTDVFNGLAWYALEEVCRAYCDLMEND